MTVSELKKFYDNTIEGRQAAKARRGETTAQTQKATAAAPASATSASTSTSGAAAEKQPQTSTSASQQPTIDWMALMAAFMQIAMGIHTVGKRGSGIRVSRTSSACTVADADLRLARFTRL